MDWCTTLLQSSMRILITGGAGFIGRHIAEHFQDRAEVRVLDSLRCGFKGNLPGLDCQLIVGSILDRDLVREAMKGVDFVFHLAAMVSVKESVQKPDECAEINAWGTAIVLEEAARARVRKLIFSSSAAIYGVLACPAIRRAIDMVGRENVYFVVFEDNLFILDAMEIIPGGNVITIATHSLFGLAASALRAVVRVRKVRIDAVVDMEFLTCFSAILTSATGAQSRIGFHTFFGDGPYRGDLMTHRLLYNLHRSGRRHLRSLPRDRQTRSPYGPASLAVRA
jgi:NAD dependent epimerase/dehydratase family